jgi:GT2 family glycosyltransferase
MRFPSLRTVLWWDTPLGAWFPDGRELRRYEMRDWDHRGSRRVEQPPGTCFIIRREAYEDVGAMDERLWLFFNDVDWAVRLERAGWAIWYLDDARVVHHLGGSTRSFADFGAEWHRNRIEYYRKHHGVVGAFLTKSALVYVALRQCWRIRAGCPDRREYRAQVRAILGAMAGIVVR